MPRQQSIPGTDVDHPIIADLIERWLEKCERVKRATEERGEADDLIVLKMLELGVAYHPYVDPETGKRKYRVVDTTPKGKSVSARPQAPEDMEPDEPEVSEDSPIGAAQAAANRLHDFADKSGYSVSITAGGKTTKLGRAKADKVESRKVSRSKAQRDIAERNAETAARVNGQPADVGEFRPARSYDDDEAQS